ncbi:MAG TPA: MgtC/SapB family protein [Puia sp.]|nr:MgtC/SapB family protein [Puia sp.]
MISWEEILIRLGLAALFGAVIGLERERKDWAAGLRTHMMVCLGATLTMLVSAYGFSEVLNQRNVVLDPSRIAAQVISGIGFIGAGTILFLRQGIIRGLTTASGLWTVAAIGLATGGGMYFAALIATLLALVILWMLQPLEKRFAERFKQKGIRITVHEADGASDIIETVFNDEALKTTSCSVDKTEEGIVIFFNFGRADNRAWQDIIKKLQSDPQVKEFAFTP